MNQFADEQPLMSVLSRLTDSLLVRLLFRSILLLLHVDNALLFFIQISNYLHCFLFRICTVYSVFFRGICMHTLVTLSIEDLSDLSWKFQFSFGFPF